MQRRANTAAQIRKGGRNYYNVAHNVNRLSKLVTSPLPVSNNVPLKIFFHKGEPVVMVFATGSKHNLRSKLNAAINNNMFKYKS